MDTTRLLSCNLSIIACPHIQTLDVHTQGGFTVEPGKAVTYSLRFAPGEENGAYTHELRVRVANNPFEDYRVALSGEGFQVCECGGVGVGSLLCSAWLIHCLSTGFDHCFCWEV